MANPILERGGLLASVRVWPPLLVLVLLAGIVSAQDISDPTVANPSLILQDFEALQLAPGESGSLQFNLTNPSPWTWNQTTLLVEIYAFRSGDETERVADQAHPPVLVGSGTPMIELSLGTLESGESQRVGLAVATEAETAHGGIFTQGAYAVRFRLTFAYAGNASAVMVSLGHFTPAEWAQGIREPTAAERAAYRWVGNANYSYFGALLGLEAIDGLLPETGFGVKDPLPLWPFTVLLVAAGGAFGLFLIAYWREHRGRAKGLRGDPD